MKLTDSIEKRVLIGDIETLADYSLFSYYDPDTAKFFEFEMGKQKNMLSEFVHFYSSREWDYVCGYNYIGFDSQIIQYLLKNWQNWADLSGQQIARLIYAETQRTIQSQKFGKRRQYQESSFAIPVIDVFTIFGLDNAARSSSLKKCQFQIDYSSVEEMPVHHSTDNISPEKEQVVKDYCKNDILSTYEILKVALGETHLTYYKGKNAIDLRFEIAGQYDLNTISSSDMSIGDELLKKSYAKEKNCAIKELPRKGTFRKIIHLKDCYPKYVSFTTPELKRLKLIVDNKSVRSTSKFQHKFKFKNTTYVLGLGGLHSVNKNQKFFNSEEFDLVDLDVSSYYPAILINNGFFPAHLGKEFLVTYKKLYDQRLELKPLAKTDKKVKGIVEAIKLVLNSAFGRMGLKEGWTFDLKALYSVTITGQLSLLMLIEQLEIHGINVFSANTDGITIRLPKTKADVFKKIIDEWQEKTKYLLERVDYKSIAYSSVNDYIAIPVEGEAKTKGQFISDFELHKNKSSRVVALALQEYFVKGTNPITFIENHFDIFDFCNMVKANNENYLELQKSRLVNFEYDHITHNDLVDHGFYKLTSDYYCYSYNDYDEETGEKITVFGDPLAFKYAQKACARMILAKNNQVEIRRLKKLVRYYITTEDRWELFKRGTGTTGKDMNVSCHADNELGAVFIKYFNHVDVKDIKNYNINYSYYILKTLKIIDQIEKSKKADVYIDKILGASQLSLF